MVVFIDALLLSSYYLKSYKHIVLLIRCSWLIIEVRMIIETVVNSRFKIYFI
jgi:hypothetical protein